MKKLITSIALLASSCVYADYQVQVPLEQVNGGSLPVNSIQFILSNSETPTDPETPTYVDTGGSFGDTPSTNSIITAQTPAGLVDKNTVTYTLTTTNKIVIDSVTLEEVSGMGLVYGNISIPYQNCTGTGPYTCVVQISATEITGSVSPYDGLGEIQTEVGTQLVITFIGKYLTNK